MAWMFFQGSIVQYINYFLCSPLFIYEDSIQNSVSLFICLDSQEDNSLLIYCIAITYDCHWRIVSMLNIGLSLNCSEDEKTSRLWTVCKLGVFAFLIFF